MTMVSSFVFNMCAQFHQVDKAERENALPQTLLCDHSGQP